eukprot:1386957-Prymnesium_polylepis.1
MLQRALVGAKPRISDGFSTSAAMRGKIHAMRSARSWQREFERHCRTSRRAFEEGKMEMHGEIAVRHVEAVNRT